MDKREPVTVKSVEPDFTMPIDMVATKEQVKQKCFGKMWDVTTKECGQCADRDVCGILMRQTVDEKAKKIAEDRGIVYLDETDFKKVTTKAILEFVRSGETTTQELVEFVAETANTMDTVAIVGFIKRFVQEHDFIYTKDSKVWLR